MKNFRTILFFALFFMYSISSYCQDVNRNRVPDWVKEITTPEEYKVWEKMNEVFAFIDYSFFEKTISKKKKEKLYERVNLLLEFLDKNRSSFHKVTLSAFAVDVLPDDAIVSSTKLVVYRSKYNQGIYVYAALSYHYNPETEEVTNINAVPFPVGITDSSFSGGNNAGFNKSIKMIQGACSGSYLVVNNTSELKDETFSNAYYYILPL